MKKAYKKSTHEWGLLAVLAQMNAQNISTLETLMQPENSLLYADLWCAMERFVNYVALQSKNTKSAEGKWVDGNAAKLRTLLDLGAELVDIRGDILLHIMEKMDKVLNRPLAAQVPYCFTICNTCLVNEYRKRCPGGWQVYSLNQPIGEEDEQFTLEDTLTDATSAEELVMAYETVYERKQGLDARHSEQLLQKRQVILQDIACLNDGAAVFTYLCFHEKLRPRHTTDLLLKQGSREDAAEVIKAQVCRKYNLQRKAVSALLDKPFINTLKLETGDKRLIRAEISRVKNRMPASVRMSLSR